MWAKEAIVIPKNHVGHVSVVTLFQDSDLCVEGGIRATRQMVPRCLISTYGEGYALVPIMNLSENDFVVKKGDTVTRGVLYNEAISLNNNLTREINQEPIIADKVISDLAAD